MLFEGVQKKDAEKVFENAAFITFNYDRCIEHYVSHWVANYLDIPLSDAESMTNSLIVIHPYGQIGRLPWQRNGLPSLPYGSKVDPRTLPKIANGIRTFTEQVEDDTVPDRMQSLISEAQQVVYLGFSFGSMNMELMRLKECKQFKTVRGSVLGMSIPNVRAITSLIEETMFFEGRTSMGTRSFDPVTCNELLNNYWRTLAT